MESFIPVPAGSYYPLQNLPYGAGKVQGGPVHVLTRLGDFAVDLSYLEEVGVLSFETRFFNRA
jgi:hypothetical protein